MPIQVYTTIQLLPSNEGLSSPKTQLPDYDDYVILTAGFDQNYATHPQYSTFYSDVMDKIVRACSNRQRGQAISLSAASFSLAKRATEAAIWDVWMHQQVVATVEFGCYNIQ